MEFNPANHIVQLCLKGMSFEEQGEAADAANIFRQAWQQATNPFEKYLAAYYIARHQPTVAEQLHWLQTAAAQGLQASSLSVNTALPSIYTRIAGYYSALGDMPNVAKYEALAAEAASNLGDEGPFYHGTRADLQLGDYLTAGNRSNYHPDIIMNHIYFTALVNGAGLAAGLAKGDAPERVYIVTPTGSFENDPNVTDKKFPGNPTRSYRTTSPLQIVGEVTDWVRQTPEELAKWRERLANVKGEIIN